MFGDTSFLGEISALQAAKEHSKAAEAHSKAANILAEKLKKWVDYARDLEAQVDDLNDRLAVALASESGLRAALNGFKRAHPDSPLMQPNGRTFKSGNPKRRYHDLYERAFDDTAREMGIDNPAERRAD